MLMNIIKFLKLLYKNIKLLNLSLFIKIFLIDYFTHKSV
jgi:hypothetical protein